LIIVDKILPNSPKTKDLAAILNAHNWNNSYVIAGEQNDNLLLASKNIEKLLVGDIYTPKLYQMMLHSNLILDLSALAHFEYLLSVE
jgi:ribosomal protein L4